MPNLRFTQDTIDALKPPPDGRTLYWDSTTPGFGLRLSATGKKTWVAQYRVNGTAKTETIGSFSDIPSVKQARERAIKSRVMAKDGIDPTEKKRAEKVVKKKLVTFAEVAERYLREYCRIRLRPSTLRETRRMLEHDILPHLGNRPLIEITRRDIKTLMERKAATRDRPRKDFTGGSGIMANRNLSKIKTFFNWCVREELIPNNPAIAVDKLVKEEERERVLTEPEIVALWHTTELIGYPYQQIIRLLLLTGQRRSEVAGMAWSEIDLDEKQWTIPRTRTKNNKTHIVHLSPPALQIIETVPHGKSDLLFPSKLNKPVDGFAKMKPYLDAKFAVILGRKPEPWVFHDLRRTCTTFMAKIGIPPHVADRVLNHTGSSIKGVAAIYNRHQYLSERQQALDTWSAYVEKVVKKRLRRVVL